MQEMKPERYDDKKGNVVDRHWFGGRLQTTMHFALTEEQALEILTIWRNKEWQTKRGVKTFRSTFNDHGYHQCFTYMLKTAVAARVAGMDNYREEYAAIFHNIDASNRGPKTHRYSVLFFPSYGEMI